MPQPDLLAYRDGSRVVIEVNGIIDLPDREATARALCRHVEACEVPEVVVRLHDPIVTTAALHAITAAHIAARGRRIALSVVVPQVAVKVFEAAGLEFLLAPEAYSAR